MCVGLRSDPEGKATKLQSYKRKPDSLPCRLGSRKRFVAVGFAWKEFSVLIFSFFFIKKKGHKSLIKVKTSLIYEI